VNDRQGRGLNVNNADNTVGMEQALGSGSMGFLGRSTAWVPRFVRDPIGYPARDLGAIFLQVANADVISYLEVRKRGHSVRADHNPCIGRHLKGFSLQSREHSQPTGLSGCGKGKRQSKECQGELPANKGCLHTKIQRRRRRYERRATSLPGYTGALARIGNACVPLGGGS